MDKDLKQFALIAIERLLLATRQENIAVENVLKWGVELIQSVLCVAWSFGTKRKLHFAQEVVAQNQDHHLCWVKNFHQSIEKRLVMQLGVKITGIGKAVLHLIKNRNGENQNISRGVRQYLKEITILVKFVLSEVGFYKPITLKVGLNIQNLERN